MLAIYSYYICRKKCGMGVLYSQKVPPKSATPRSQMKQKEQLSFCVITLLHHPRFRLLHQVLFFVQVRGLPGGQINHNKTYHKHSFTNEASEIILHRCASRSYSLSYDPSEKDIIDGPADPSLFFFWSFLGPDLRGAWISAAPLDPSEIFVFFTNTGSASDARDIGDCSVKSSIKREFGTGRTDETDTGRYSSDGFGTLSCSSLSTLATGGGIFKSHERAFSGIVVI